MPHIQPDTHLPETPRVRTWIAYMSQTGTNAPVVDQLLQNTLGQNLVWTRAGTGEYQADGDGQTIINANNTVVTISNVTQGFIFGNWAAPNAIYIATAIGVGGSETYQDGLLTDNVIEIRIYTID